MSDLRAWLDGEGWVVHVFLVVLATGIVAFVARRLVRRVLSGVERTRTPWDDALVGALDRPLGVFIWVVGLAIAADIAGAITASPLYELVIPARDLGVIATLAWFLIRFIRRAEENLIAAGELRGKPVDRTTLDAVAKLLRVSVIITAVLVALQTLGYSVSGVLAFGGIGGLAVGFAARDLLANFFGGLMVYLDRPFAVGDWIRSPDRAIEGTVEEIGWRLTRIRTFDARPLYVPNSIFTTISVENPSRMLNRRIYETIGVRYQDADKVGTIVERVEQMLRAHPDIATERTLIVNFNAFAPSSLDFFIYAYTRTTEWVRYHQVKQDVLLRVMEIIREAGAEIAYPTSTVHLESAPLEVRLPATGTPELS